MKQLLITTIAAVLLVGCGESPKAPDISIHGAVIVGNIETVKQHLAAGTDVNAKNWGDGSTPLHGAAFNGHKEMAELLLSNGAEVNARLESIEHKGLTPLDVAELPSENDSPEMIVAKKEFFKFLRKHGGKTGDELKAEGK
jgi:ankyrin repeat protein